MFTRYNYPKDKMFIKAVLDFGRDGMHPGAKTHQAFAEQVVADPTGPAVGFSFI